MKLPCNQLVTESVHFKFSVSPLSLIMMPDFRKYNVLNYFFAWNFFYLLSNSIRESQKQNFPTDKVARHSVFTDIYVYYTV